jgi:hypothetical protein
VPSFDSKLSLKKKEGGNIGFGMGDVVIHLFSKENDAACFWCMGTNNT